jgi:hypothetical protein
MAKLYSDEDFPGPVVTELRRLGHDVITAKQAGQTNQQLPDSHQLAYATNLGRVILTRNRWHFIRLHRHVRPHAGILACSDDPDYVALAGKIHQVLLASPNLANQLIRITKS